jgi:hypothetical protein
MPTKDTARWVPFDPRLRPLPGRMRKSSSLNGESGVEGSILMATAQLSLKRLLNLKKAPQG